MNEETRHIENITRTRVMETKGTYPFLVTRVLRTIADILEQSKQGDVLIIRLEREKKT